MQMKWLGEAAYRMTPDMCENRISANLMDSARESTFTCVLDLKYAILKPEPVLNISPASINMLR